ncbi:MAG TPA: lamin tail domain-containing protein, partial [Clostridia bacterium]|nr:lamin tail domain-containing protein [Clostridia bacterium]
MTQPGLREALGIPIAQDAGGTVSAAYHTGIRVTELMSSNKSAYPDDQGLFSDWIEVTNLGETAESLLGFGLSDDASRVRFVFPDIALEPGEALLVFASGQEQAQAGAALHASFKLSSAGEAVCLFNAQGDLIEQIDLPPLGPDAREGNGFVKTSEPTPGYPNTAAGRESFLGAWSMEESSLQLNEIMAANAHTLTDADGEYVDWIELYNRGDETIDLSQYALSDDPSNPILWRFPAGATIEPKGYFLVYASGKNRADPDAPHTNFKLRANGETVLLSDLLGHVLDSTTYDNLKDDTVWARWGNNSPWTVINNPT